MAAMAEALAVGSALPASRAETFVAPRAGLAAFGPPGTAGVARLEVDGAAVALVFAGTYFAPRVEAGNGAPLPPAERMLRIYVEQGIDALTRALGELSVAVWDGRTETLHVATDRFRVHPIVYAEQGGAFAFASRMAALRRAPGGLRLTLEPESIVDMIGSSIVPSPRTIFREAQKLPPAHLLTRRGDGLTLTRYWDISFASPSREPERVLAARVRRALEEAVRIRMEAAGPNARCGAFLSGGIDSSTVAGLLTLVGKAPTSTFSIGFAEQEFNELRYAGIAARHFGTHHHEYRVTPQDVVSAIPALLDGPDEPFGNASAVPTYFCGKIAREAGVTVLFAGDGGDELFAGNKRYAQHRIFEYYSHLPGPLRDGLIPPVVSALADATRLSPFVWGRKYIQRARIPLPERLTSYGFYRTVSIAELYRPEFLKQISPEYRPSWAFHGHYRNAPAPDPLTRQLYADLKVAISDNDLFKVTRMTAAAGIGVQFPFLDPEVAEVAGSVPSSLLMRGQELRTFFKRAYADFLAPETIQKTKHGFGLPIPVWLRTDRTLNELMRDHLLAPSSRVLGFLQRDAVESLLARHQEDKTSFYGTALWNLVVLELWLRRFDGPDAGR